MQEDSPGQLSASQGAMVQYPPGCETSQRRSPWAEHSVDVEHESPISAAQPAKDQQAAIKAAKWARRGIMGSGP